MKCLYHANCNDGLAAAMAVWLAHPDMLPRDFVPVQYGSEPPWDVIQDQDVVIVDFWYKRVWIQAIHLRARSLLVLDHHASAERELEGLDCVVFDMNASGAVLAWNHFHPNEPIPDLFLYVQDRDLWRNELSDSQAVTMYLRSWTQDLRTWRWLMSVPVERMVQEGKPILRWYEQERDRLVAAWREKPVYGEIAGWRVPMINVPGFMVSDIAGELAVGHPFAVGYFHVADGVVFSLRRRVGDLDLSEVAASLGGGGHAAAAGFKKDLGHLVKALGESD